MSSLRNKTAALLRNGFDYDIDGFPPDDPTVSGFNATVAMVEAHGGTASDAGVVFLLNVCAIRLPVWDTLPTNWGQESRTRTVADFISLVRLYSAAVIIYDAAERISGIAGREQFTKIYVRLLRLEEMFGDGGWIRKSLDGQSLKTIIKLPQERTRIPLRPKGFFKRLFGGDAT